MFKPDKHDNQEMRAAFIAGAAWCSPSPAGERETAWLIERQYPINGIGATKPHWYAERPNGYHWWTDVPNRAKRFASKAAAEADTAYSLIASDPAISITEHVWINDGFSWSHGQVLYDRGHTVICPDCRGNRRTANGLLCSRCGGTAQISRSALRAGEIAPFEANPSPSPAGGERMGESLPWDDIREFAAKWIVKAEKPPTFYTEQAVDTFANEILSLCVRAIEKNERNAVKSRDRRINSLASDNATLRSEVERLKFTMTTAAKGLRGQYAGRYEMAELLEISAALKPEATPND